jgi:DNA-binding NtrC family response regulator
LEPEVEAAVAELDALRAKTYAEVYAAREAHAACTRPVVNLRKKGEDDAFELVGTSPAMERLREQIPEAAAISGALLLIGEPGSGRELVARSIHRAANLERSRFFRLSPRSLSPHVVDSELFGHVDRAGTRSYPGLLRAAEGGTLFIDELTALSPEVQAKLLHVLERRAVRPVGADEDEPVNVRVIAATSRDLDEAVASGALRGDLCSRLRDLTVYVPPLRERRSDIPQLCEHFLTTFCHRQCGCIFGISDRSMQLLLAADWPGNVRELRNAIEHAVSNGEGGVVRVDDLPQYLWRGLSSGENGELDRLPTLAEAEEQLIRTTLRHFDGNKLRAARSLGISRHKLYDRLRKLGL